jgi:apolipoprotein N-acyltransferase
MKLSRAARIFLACASGVFLGLSFPNYNLTMLAWVGIAFLILASLDASAKEAPRYGFLHGLFFYPTCLPWIDVVIRQYGNVDPFDAAGILALIGIAGGIILMIFSSSVAFLSRRASRTRAHTRDKSFHIIPGLPIAAAPFLLAPFLWITLEYARTHLPIIGFPWNLTGYAASNNLAFLQIAALAGIWGLSLLIASFNALLAAAAYFRTRRLIAATAITALALIIIALAGPHLIPQAPARYVAHLVQTNFPQSEHYPADWMDTHQNELSQLEQISIDAGRRDPGLIIWPEVPAPFSAADVKFKQLEQDITRTSGDYLLIGVVDWRIGPSQNGAGNLWQASNSAVLYNPAGERAYSYDKIHLVPFGEYVPLRNWIKFAGRLTADISDFTPGKTYNIGRLPGGTFGTFICYEAIFPSEIRNFTKNGAQLLINISNDGWFGRSAAPAQHLMMSRVRAVENRRWLLRDTNNGYTVSVDPYGRIAASLPTDVRSQLDAPFDFRTDSSLYSLLGDWLPWLSILLSLLLLSPKIRST